MNNDKSEALKKTGSTAIDPENAKIADSPEEIRSQIENTRQQMGETIGEIQNRLSIENITEQVKEEVSEQISGAWQTTKETVLEATVNTTGEIMGYVNKGLNEISDTKIGQAARDNPIALTLIGAGLGMLVYNAYQSKSSTRFYGERNTRSLSTGGAGDSSSLESAKSKAGQAYDSVTDTAGTAYSKTANAAGQAYRAIGSTASSALDSAGNVGLQVKETAQNLTHKAQDQYDYYIEENPLAVGAVALAIGAAVGLSIPSTNVESNLMGETRDNLMQQATDKVYSLIDTAENTVREKVEDIKTVAADKTEDAVKQAKTAADKSLGKAANDSGSSQTGGKRT